MGYVLLEGAINTGISSNKTNFIGCKWSSLNAKGSETPKWHPILKFLYEFPRSSFFASRSHLNVLKFPALNDNVTHQVNNKVLIWQNIFSILMYNL